MTSLPRSIRISLSAAGACAAALGVALSGPTSAAADSSTPSPYSSNAPSSTSSPSSDLGGFQISGTGSGITWSYEQPNFPVPATPTLELNLGYSTTTYDAGPTGESLASTLWPGQVAANALGQIGILLQPYLGSNTPNLQIGPWPIQASSSYPPAPTTPSSASQDSPGVRMEASSTQDAGNATASFGSSSGGANSYALPSGFISVDSLASAVQSTVQNGEAVAQATSEVHGISIAGGLIKIGQVTSTATSTSDGSQAKVDGTSTAAGVDVAGQAVTLDSSGVHVVGNSAPIIGSVLPNAQQLLSTAGISLTLTNPTDTVNGASGARQLDGVQLKIDLTTLDKRIDTLVASLPQQLQTQVIDMLPLPPPDAQILTVDFGWVNVNAAASPAYNSGFGTSTSSDEGLGGPSPNIGTAPGQTGLGSTGSGASSSPSASAVPSGSTGLSAAATTTPAKLFQGIGAGLIALGVILALLLASVLWRADKAVGALTAAAPCVGERPVAIPRR